MSAYCIIPNDGWPATPHGTLKILSSYAFNVDSIYIDLYIIVLFINCVNNFQKTRLTTNL